MINIVLTSQSAIKEQAVRAIIDVNNCPVNLLKFQPQIPDPEQCPQPIGYNSGLKACRNRIKNCKLEMQDALLQKPIHYIVSIENYIEVSDSLNGSNVNAKDIPLIIVYNVHEDWEQISLGHEIPIPDMDILKELIKNHMYADGTGASITFGSLYHKKYPQVPADNWMKFTAKMNRQQQIEYGLMNSFDDLLINQTKIIQRVQSKFRFYTDFKYGFKFIDFSDIFLDILLLDDFITYLASKYTEKIDYVIGLETRGCMLGLPLAIKLVAGFIPIQKAEKTAGSVVNKSYKTEYGDDDTMGLRNDLQPGKVLIIDDVLATGGSLLATVELARSMGHEVVDAIVITDVPSLRVEARKKLHDYPIRVVITTYGV